MRRKDWTGSKRTAFAIIGASNHSLQEREKQDLYCTDPASVEALLRVEHFSHKIWEPAVGLGHIASVLERHGYEVVKSDIVNRMGNDVFDFLSNSRYFTGDIVTNPPYRMAKDFVEQALLSVPDKGKVAMLLKLTFLEGKERRKFFEEFPPIRVWVFSERQCCAKNGDFEESKKVGSAICYAWFIWEKGFKGSPSIGWI